MARRIAIPPGRRNVVALFGNSLTATPTTSAASDSPISSSNLMPCGGSANHTTTLTVRYFSDAADKPKKKIPKVKKKKKKV